MDKFTICQSIAFYELDSVYGDISTSKPYVVYNVNYLVECYTRSVTHNKSKLIFDSEDIPIPTKGVICILPTEVLSRFDIDHPGDIIHQQYILPPTIEEKDDILSHTININTSTDPVYFKIMFCSGKYDRSRRDNIGNYYIFRLYKVYVYHHKEFNKK